MKTLVMGTTNPAKIAQVAAVLAPLGIQVQGADKSKLPLVEEDGITAEENARKKAVAYAAVLKLPVLSMDNALYLDGLSDTQQPGIHVRRIDGVTASSDEELLRHYQDLIASLGQRIGGYWEFALCVAHPDGRVWETTVRQQRIFTSEPSLSRIEGYPLESIQIDPKSGKYVAEMSREEQAQFWQDGIGKPLCEFVASLRL